MGFFDDIMEIFSTKVPTITATMIGPSRVGKTTLVAAAIAGMDAQVRKINTTDGRLSCQAVGEAGEILRDLVDKIKGMLDAETFDAAIIGGTEKEQLFSFEVRGRSLSLPFHILDFPGAWLTGFGGGGHAENWDQHIKPTLESSNALIIPIDAALIMSAATGKEKATCRSTLMVSAVCDIVQRWACETQIDKKMLILAPVKCETYFTDNVVNIKDRSKELGDAIGRIYGEMLDKARVADPSISIEYHPIDTFGSVCLKGVDWNGPNGKLVEHYMAYGARPKGTSSWQPMCGDVLLNRIVLHALETEWERKGWLGRFLNGDMEMLIEQIKKGAKRRKGSRWQDWSKA